MATRNAVGDGLAASGVARQDVHLTSKCHHSIQCPDQIRAAFAESLRLLRTDYLDLYLLHWPRPGTSLPAALEAMMALQEAGLARQIGVANCTVAHLRQALEKVRAPVVCNQIEYHVLIDQTPALSLMRAHNLQVIAHVPLAQGRLASHPTLRAGLGNRDRHARLVNRWQYRRRLWMREWMAGVVAVVGLCGCMPAPPRGVVAATTARPHPPAHRSLAASTPHRAVAQNAVIDPAKERLFQDFLIWRGQRLAEVARFKGVGKAVSDQETNLSGQTEDVEARGY